MLEQLGRPFEQMPASKMIELTDREWKWFQSKRVRKWKQALRSALRRHDNKPKLTLAFICKLPMYR